MVTTSNQVVPNISLGTFSSLFWLSMSAIILGTSMKRVAREKDTAMIRYIVKTSKNLISVV